jgi:hypothetical protein
MRLYNANSRTPCSAAGDGGAARRLPPEPRSFVPPPLDHASDRTQHEPAKCDKDFQQLSNTPSTTTSTTGGLTPPSGNTASPSSIASGHEGNPQQVLVDHRDKPSRKATIQPRMTQPVRIQARRDPRRASSLPPRHELVGLADFDTTDELSKSSSSTLTTTRSMMLQQQHACTITVTSDSDTTTTNLTKQDPQPAASKRWPKMGARQSTSDQFRKSSKYESMKTHVPSSTMNDGACANEKVVPQHGSNHGYMMPSTVPINSPDASGAIPNVLIGGNVQIPSSRIDPVKGASPFAATLTPGQVPPRSRATGFADKLIETKDRVRQYERSVHDHAARDMPLDNARDSLEELGTYYYSRETPTARPVRVDFFPLQVSKSTADKSSPIGEERLGVTSNFPKHAWTHTGNVETAWDPLHEEAFSDSRDRGEPLAWATFGSVEDLGYPSKLGSFDVGNSTVYSFPDSHDASCESEDTSALLGSENDATKDNIVCIAEDVSETNNATDGDDTATNNNHPTTNSTDARKVLARQRGIGTKALQRQPRLEFLQTPKLLGPLLEARFTRSYWRRLNHANKGSRSTVAIDKRHRTKGDAVDRDLQVMERSVAEEPDSVWQANGDAISGQDWWGALWHEQEATVSESNLEQAVQKVDDGWVTAPLWAGEAKVLSQRRVSECDAVLAGIPLDTNDILEAIDVADPTAPLDLKQLESLRSLVPTPTEERMLSKHSISARKTPSICISAKAEKFMLELSGVEGARQKLEAMMFPFEFNVDVGKMCKGTSWRRQTTVSTMFAISCSR